MGALIRGGRSLGGLLGPCSLPPSTFASTSVPELGCYRRRVSRSVRCCPHLAPDTHRCIRRVS